MSSEILYLKDAYLKEEKALINAVSYESGIQLDRSIFYPRGGGQPGDQGLLRLQNKNIEIVETIKGPNGEINLIPSIMDDLVELKKGDEVIVPAVSWSTTFFPITQYGLKLVFVDINLRTLNIDENKVENYFFQYV